MDLLCLNREEFLKAVREKGKVVVVLGSIEDHGILPLGCDTLIPTEVAREVSKLTGVPFLTVSLSFFERDFPGNVGVSKATFEALVNELAESLRRNGVKEIVFLCGHDEAWGVAKTYGRAFKWWELAYPEIEEILKSRMENLGPGGEDENSLLLYLGYTQAKNRADVRTWKEYEERVEASSRQLIVGYPEEASVEKGRRLFEVLVRKLAEIVKE